MRQPPAFVRVITACRPLLRTVTGDDGGVRVQGDASQGAGLVEEPATGLYPFMAQHIKAAKQVHDGFVPGNTLSSQTIGSQERINCGVSPCAKDAGQVMGYPTGARGLTRRHEV